MGEDRGRRHGRRHFRLRAGCAGRRRVCESAGVGDEVTAEEAFGDVESVKAVSDLISPVSGVVLEVNEELLDHPELLNSDPYGNWLIKVEQVTDTEELLDAAAYEAFCAQEG